MARTLLDKGFRLRALSRPNNDRRNIAGLEMDIAEGDLDNPQTYRDALKDCDALFHVAADYRIWVPDPAAMHRINVDGTHALMDAAMGAKVKRIVSRAPSPRSPPAQTAPSPTRHARKLCQYDRHV